MIKCERSGNRMTAFFSGEIDHHTAATIRHKMDEELSDQRITHLHLNFEKVSFMDSSGIGMIIGRYKIMIARNGKTTASGMSPSLERIYRLAGLHRIIPMGIGGENDERK